MPIPTPDSDKGIGTNMTGISTQDLYKALWLSGKEICLQCRSYRKHRFNPWVRKIPWRRAWQPTPVFLPGESHGQGSLVGYSPWGRKELAMTETT